MKLDNSPTQTTGRGGNRARNAELADVPAQTVEFGNDPAQIAKLADIPARMEFEITGLYWVKCQH